MPRSSRAVLGLLLGTAMIGCAPSPTPPATVAPAAGSLSATPGASTSPPTEPTPINTDGAELGGVPTSCWGLRQDDCQRVVRELASELEASDPLVVYIQVGPFGCQNGERCPTTLEARPQGDVTLDAGMTSLWFHVTATGAVPALRFERQKPLTGGFPPSSTPPLTAGPQPFELGHCGLWSGIDAGGSWWDPVGQVDSDHPDAINAARGTLTVADPDHATFVSQGGLTVALLRRNGPKSLPGCT